MLLIVHVLSMLARLAGTAGVHDPEFAPELGEAEISPSVLPYAKSETRTERSNSGFDSCRRRNEIAQSRLGMSAYRCTDQLGVWGPY
jgi:hypothetical protein